MDEINQHPINPAAEPLATAPAPSGAQPEEHRSLRRSVLFNAIGLLIFILLVARVLWHWQTDGRHVVALAITAVWIVAHLYFGPRMYLNPIELRAGWRLLIYAATVAAIFSTLRLLSLLLPPRFGGGPNAVITPVPALIFELTMFAVFVLATFIFSRAEKRPMRAYGLPWREAFRKNFLVGALWGFAALSALVAVLFALHDFSYGTLALHGGQIAYYALVWAGVFICVGFFEEYSLRGYPQFTLTTGMGFWPAAIITSLVFGFLHTGNPGEDRWGLLAVVLAGLFFCLTLWKTGTLWWAIGFHAGWDWAQSYFYGTPDSGLKATGHLMNSAPHGPASISGGSVGPEGSVLIIPMFILLFAAFHFVYRKRLPYPDPAALKPRQDAGPQRVAPMLSGELGKI
jgi:CAAX protease family protein